MQCMFLTPQELAALQAQGWTVAGGPYATEAECLAHCSASSSSSYHSSSASGSGGGGGGKSAPTVHGTGDNAASNGSGGWYSNSMTVPSFTMSVGDLLVGLGLHYRGVGYPISPPAGWTQYLFHSHGDVNLYVWSKTATLSDVGASFTFSVTNTGETPVLSLCSLSGATSIEALSSYTDTTTSPVSAPSVTTLSANDLVIAVWGADASSTGFTLPGTVTQLGRQIYEFIFQANPINFAAAYYTQAAAGASGAKSASITGIANASAFQIAVKP